MRFLPSDTTTVYYWPLCTGKPRLIMTKRSGLLLLNASLIMHASRSR